MSYVSLEIASSKAAAALAVICGTRFLIDRFRLARCVVYLLIFSDNTIHIIINGSAIAYLS
jgi:hypothetical protein